jgi:DNA-binding GntR family transcriptional regulator
MATTRTVKATMGELIAHAVTQAIIRLDLPPGAEIDEAALGRAHGASRTPVREALRQLASAGLVELRPHRAPRVVAVDTAELAEMFDAMGELEALCAARAAAAMPRRERDALQRLHLAMAAAVRTGDFVRYRDDNVAFHDAIYLGSANRYLREAAHAMRRRLAPHRGVQLTAPARLAASYREHEAIVTAILRGDAVAAAGAARRHLLTTQEALAALRDQAHRHAA